MQRLQNTNGQLKNYNTTRIQKTAQAQQLKPGYDRRLKAPIKFNVYFEPNTANAELDGRLGFKVVIAPNTTEKSGSVPTKKRDDYLEPARQFFEMRDFTRREFQNQFELKQSTADSYLQQWAAQGELAKYSSGTSKVTYYSFDQEKIQKASSTQKSDSVFTQKLNDYLEQIRRVFEMRRFTREELQKELNIEKSTAARYLAIWLDEGQIHKYATGSRDKGTQYTFDSEKGGERDYSGYLEEAKQVFGMERFTRSALQKHFKFQEYQALNCLNEWINDLHLFKYSLGKSDSLTEYTFDENKGGDRDCLEQAKIEFGMRRFKRAEFQKKFQLVEDTALKRLNKWVDDDGVLFRYLSRQGDRFTQYTFDRNKGGIRETTGDNRVIYGYKNPGKHTKVGVQILSKGLRADSPQPIQATSAEYHKKMARYDSKRPDSKYENFGYELACLGHGPEGASDHWNRIGHTQTKDQNMEWNNNPDNYWGPEHKVESQASSSKADEFKPPSKERDSHPSWWSKNP
ncbi:hypothetical protein QUB37_29270 [Microcoleus sp. AT3-A2]|uniref:hypothetical protein n=1 Tax=Microcoleus sp. AT3-A2 TaxID=2818610 RepID=UPI002FD45C77